jgi:hypothetical protein
MRKIVAVLIWVVLVFGLLGGVQAAPILVGSFDKGLTPYASGSPLEDLTSPYIDTAVNLNALIDIYNDTVDPDLPEIAGTFFQKKAPTDFPEEWGNGTINLSPGLIT